MKDMLRVIFFIIGNIVGAGFLFLPVEIAFLGRNIILSWCIAGGIALVFSWIFGQLSCIKPNASTLSDYFEDIAMKKSLAFLYWVSVVIANTLFLEIQGMEVGIYSVILSFFIVLVLSLLNHFLDYDTISNIEIIITSLKFLIILLLPIYIYTTHSSSFSLDSGMSSNYVDIIKKGIVCFWGFVGIECVNVFGKGKTARNSLLIAVIISLLLYTVASIFVVGMVPYSIIKQDGTPFASLLSIYGHANLVRYMVVVTAFICIGTLYGWMAGTSRMALSFAENELFPQYFLRKTKSGTSFYGLWISSAAMFILFTILNVPYIRNMIDVRTIFGFIVDICLSLFCLVFTICAYKLIDISYSKFDKMIGIIGIIIGIICLSAQIINSFIAITLFTLYYTLQKF